MTIFLRPDWGGSVPSKNGRLGSVLPNNGVEAWVCDLCGVVVCACVCAESCWLHIRIHLQRLPNRAAMPLNMAPAKESFSRLEMQSCGKPQSVEAESRLRSLHCSAPTDSFHYIPKSQTEKFTETGKFYHVSHHRLHIITIQNKSTREKASRTKDTTQLGYQWIWRGTHYQEMGRSELWWSSMHKRVCLVCTKSWDRSPNR